MLGMAEAMNPAQEREFLIRLAPIWLACRWRVLGHHLSSVGRHWPTPDLTFDLLGMTDYGHELKLLCEEVKCSIRSS